MPPKNYSDHLANERTFLAWIRTSLGVIAFGFVIERFALFMKQMSVILGDKVHFTNPSLGSNGYSAFIGVVLVFSGTLMSFLAYIQFKTSQRQIDQGIYRSPSLLYLCTTLLVCSVGAVLVIYLISFSK